jgi:hypothetical protein
MSSLIIAENMTLTFQICITIKLEEVNDIKETSFILLKIARFLTYGNELCQLFESY